MSACTLRCWFFEFIYIQIQRRLVIICLLVCLEAQKETDTHTRLYCTLTVQLIGTLSYKKRGREKEDKKLKITQKKSTESSISLYVLFFIGLHPTCFVIHKYNCSFCPLSSSQLRFLFDIFFAAL